MRYKSAEFLGYRAVLSAWSCI